ncbi:MAG: hypothetical protein IBJ18_08590 [Phycisphaerales bacterium]|jgi:hypothetical protein|nr:hypothetical protein [Phycisphaerales bacterium]
MRHPLLRILVALLIGVIAPLCCCQVMGLTGSVCGGRHEVATASESCCQGCSGDPVSSDEQQTPSDGNEHAPRKCPSCPSCQGTAVGTAVKFEARVQVLDQQLHALATIALAVLWELPTLDARAAPSLPGWASDPPFLKANREALRWHCALLV